ncbi:hypothetical protein PFISCL1PPCAC_25273, partial [Pristionchus fissidentatus]
ETALFTRHKIGNGSITQVSRGIHARIKLNDEQQISIWSMHLDYRAYGPYKARDDIKTTAQEIVDNEIRNS